MRQHCTCGTELAHEALFCHKCGRPQRELVEPEPDLRTYVEFPPPETEPVAPPPVAAPPPEPQPQPLPLNFRNPQVVRIASIIAMIATLLSFMPFLNWLLAGFAVVIAYYRRTRSALNVRGGVRLGWITGILMFVLWTLMFTIEQLPAALNGNLGNTLLQQMNTLHTQDPAVQQMMAGMLQTGPGLFFFLSFLLVASFFFIIGLSIAGGAIGARLLKRALAAQ